MHAEKKKKIINLRDKQTNKLDGFYTQILNESNIQHLQVISKTILRKMPIWTWLPWQHIKNAFQLF